MKARTLLVALALLIPAGGIPAAADTSAPVTSPHFAPYEEIVEPFDNPLLSGSPIPKGVAIGDVTGDGLNDVLVSTDIRLADAHPYESKLFVFPQQSDGTLGAPAILPNHEKEHPKSVAIAVGRLGVPDGTTHPDTRNDVALATSVGVDIYYQTPAGTLLPPILLPTKTPPTQVIIADMDGFGHDDLVVVTEAGIESPAEILFYKNLGFFGALSPVVILGPGSLGDPPPMDSLKHPMTEIEVGDVVGNTQGLDIIGFFGDTVYVFEQHSDSVGLPTNTNRSTYFSDPVLFPAIVESPADTGGGLEVADVDGDGLVDVMLTISSTGSGALLNVWRQIGVDDERTLADPVAYPMASQPGAIEAADMDDDGSTNVGDGRADIVTVHGSEERLGVLLPRPDGSLVPECFNPIPMASYPPRSIAIGDVNSDGRPDVVLATDKGLAILRQQDVVPDVSIGGSSSVTFAGSPVSFSGALDLSGVCPLEGQEVLLVRAGPGGEAEPKVVSTGRTAADGSYLLADLPSGGAFTYWVEWPGDRRTKPARSAPLQVLANKLTPSLNLKLSSHAVGALDEVHLRAHLDPHELASNWIVRLYVTPTGGQRTLAAQGQVDQNGDLHADVVPGASGVIEAEWAGDDKYLPAKVSRSIGVHADLKGKLLGSTRRRGTSTVYKAFQKPIFQVKVAPKHTGDRLRYRVEVQNGGTWKLLDTAMVRIGSTGLARDDLPRKLGTFRVRASFSGDQDHLAEQTKWAYYKIVPA